MPGPRLFYQYGPFEDERRLVPTVILALLNNRPAETTFGEQRRDYLHVSDVAAALWAVARAEITGPVNIGSGSPVAVGDIVAAIGQLIGRSELIRLGAKPNPEGEPAVVYADISRLMSTGWTPQYELKQGLSDTIDWWQRRSPRR